MKRHESSGTAPAGHIDAAAAGDDDEEANALTNQVSKHNRTRSCAQYHLG